MYPQWNTWPLDSASPLHSQQKSWLIAIASTNFVEFAWFAHCLCRWHHQNHWLRFGHVDQWPESRTAQITLLFGCLWVRSEKALNSLFLGLSDAFRTGCKLLLQLIPKCSSQQQERRSNFRRLCPWLDVGGDRHWCAALLQPRFWLLFSQARELAEWKRYFLHLAAKESLWKGRWWNQGPKERPCRWEGFYQNGSEGSGWSLTVLPAEWTPLYLHQCYGARYWQRPTPETLVEPFFLASSLWSDSDL